MQSKKVYTLKTPLKTLAGKTVDALDLEEPTAKEMIDYGVDIADHTPKGLVNLIACCCMNFKESGHGREILGQLRAADLIAITSICSDFFELSDSSATDQKIGK